MILNLTVQGSDLNLAFAVAGAMRRFDLPAHSHICATGEQARGTIAHASVYELLRRLGCDISRYRALPGKDIGREAARQQHRLLREDIDAAWGDEGNVPAHYYRVGNACVHPRRPVNTEPRGYAGLDLAFEATFNVG